MDLTVVMASCRMEKSAVNDLIQMQIHEIRVMQVLHVEAVFVYLICLIHLYVQMLQTMLVKFHQLLEVYVQR